MISTDPEISYLQGIHNALISLVERGSVDQELIEQTKDDIIRLQTFYPDIVKADEIVSNDVYVITGVINKVSVTKVYKGVNSYVEATQKYVRDYSPAGCVCIEVVENIVSCSKV